MANYQNQNWVRKFYNAFRGIWICLISQNSFWLHVPFALLVIVLGFLLQVTATEGMILALCITIVMALELVNTSIEYLVKQVTSEESPYVKDSLDAAAGAVLIASIGAAVVGGWILLPKLYAWLFVAA